MNLLGLLSPRVWIGIGLSIAVGFLAALIHRDGFKAGALSVQVVLEKERGEWADARSSALKQSLQQAERFLAKQQADAEELDKVQHHAQTLLDEALADRDAANARSLSLRNTTTVALNSLRRGTPEAPATATECAAADTAARVFADLFGRANEAAGILASYADAARIAGQACISADEVTR